MCNKNSNCNGSKPPVGMVVLPPEMKQEIGKLWRELSYLAEQVEQLSLQVSGLSKLVEGR